MFGFSIPCGRLMVSVAWVVMVFLMRIVLLGMTVFRCIHRMIWVAWIPPYSINIFLWIIKVIWIKLVIECCVMKRVISVM